MKKIGFLFLIIVFIIFGTKFYIDYKSETNYPLETLRLISISRNTAKFECSNNLEEKTYKIVRHNDVEAMANSLLIEGLHYVRNQDTIDWEYRIIFRYKLLDDLYENNIDITKTMIELNRELVVMIGYEGILIDGKLYNDKRLHGKENLTTCEMIINSFDIYYNDNDFGELVTNYR